MSKLYIYRLKTRNDNLINHEQASKSIKDKNINLQIN